MNIFFDTSALVKFFSTEEGSDRVSQWILDDRNTLWILELAILEYHSAIYRKLRNREIDGSAFETAVEGFRNELKRFHVEPLGSIVAREATQLLHRHGRSSGLRTLDALHAAAFLLISEENWYFAAADSQLLLTVQNEGRAILNPLG